MVKEETYNGLDIIDNQDKNCSKTQLDWTVYNNNARTVSGYYNYIGKQQQQENCNWVLPW